MSGQAKAGQTGGMDDAVRRYRDEITTEYQPMFDRLHQLITGTCPDADVVLSYGMPTYRIGRRRLNVAIWAHGLSLYVSPSRDAGFSARPPGAGGRKGDHQAQARGRRTHPGRRNPGPGARRPAQLTWQLPKTAFGRSCTDQKIVRFELSGQVVLELPRSCVLRPVPEIRTPTRHLRCVTSRKLGRARRTADMACRANGGAYPPSSNSHLRCEPGGHGPLA